ncbi:MAG: hypothetical protein KAT52_04985 [Desulfobacterales bacterium]|nr:hypothetical protein [Desulfobacterales bacterium]
MKGDTIPDQNHIARFCRPMQAPEGQIQATAFMLRADDESLSVNWLEFLNCSNRENEITKMRTIYSETFDVGARARIAILNVGEVRKKVLTESQDGRNLEVLHDPLINDLSHSGIYNLKQDDELMIAELILETVRESYSARK